MKILVSILGLLLIAGFCDNNQEQTYEYLFFTPTNKSLSSEEGKLPLIVFLHGAGERGTDLEKVRVHGPPKLVQTQEDFPFMLLSPLCPLDTWWDEKKLDLLLDQIVQTQPVDVNRIYLTGLSMGGFGTWNWAILRPDRFAAIAPICGGSEENVSEVTKIQHIPTWVFHGAKDEVVPLSASSHIVDALKDLGTTVKFTVYPEPGHDSWTDTYNNPMLFDWFESHRLRQ